jgi:hypothetical protein
VAVHPGMVATPMATRAVAGMFVSDDAAGGGQPSASGAAAAAAAAEEEEEEEEEREAASDGSSAVTCVDRSRNCQNMLHFCYDGTHPLALHALGACVHRVAPPPSLVPRLCHPLRAHTPVSVESVS